MSRVRSNDELGAQDVAVGQVWYRAVSQAPSRYEVVDLTGSPPDRVRLKSVLRDEFVDTGVGSLLAYFVLVEEA